MGDFWNYAPVPGVLTVVLAFFAALISMPPINKHLEKETNSWLRWLCIGVFFLLAAGEIFVIRHAEHVSMNERQAQNTEHLRELQKQDTQFFEEMAALIDLKESIKSGLADVKARIVKEKSQTTPDSLKVDTLQLTKDILDFLSYREGFRPPVTSSRGTSYTAVYDQWQRETIAAYISKFDQQIISLAELYAKRGVDTKGVEAMCLKPVNALMIPVCAGEIQALTGRLPN